MESAVPPIDARQLAEQLDDTPFSFIGMDGETYELPNIRTLSADQGRRLDSGDDSLLEELAPEAWAALQQMPIGVSEQIAQGWVEASTGPGKSGSPLSATKSAGGRSKSTARSGASKRKS